MSGAEILKKYNLPESIKVEVKLTPEGYLYAKLPDYPGCMTEAENILDLIKNINDAILTYFAVPRKVAEKSDIVYLTPDLLTRKVDPIDKLIKAQELKREYKNIAVKFNYYTSFRHSHVNHPGIW